MTMKLRLIDSNGVKYILGSIITPHHAYIPTDSSTNNPYLFYGMENQKSCFFFPSPFLMSRAPIRHGGRFEPWGEEFRTGPGL